MAIRTVTVRRRLGASAAQLFATLTEPERFARVRGIRSVEVLEEGSSGSASVGTLRRVNLAAGYLVEEIVALEAPNRFDYLIRDAPVSFDHRFGRVEFHDRGDHTEAVWTSTFAFDTPVVGALVAGVAAAGSYIAFAAVLREIDRAALASPPDSEES